MQQEERRNNEKARGTIIERDKTVQLTLTYARPKGVGVPRKAEPRYYRSPRPLFLFTIMLTLSVRGIELRIG